MDSILLFPPGASGVTGVGSAIQLGSWLNAGEAGDLYGAAGLIQSMQAENSLRDGGVFAFRHAPVRHMQIPLIVNTPSVVNWEALLARYSTPGAYIAVQPEGIPSSQAVYFDVIDGRYEPAHNTFENRAHIRKGTLHLDTQPFGYWPTEILLASAASIGFIGNLAVNGASVIGDAPPLAHVTVMPTSASVYQVAAGLNWFTDMIALSFGGRPSFAPFIPPAAFTGATLSVGGPALIVPTLTADAFAPASQAQRWTVASLSAQWQNGAWGAFAVSASAIGSALEPAYRGRFRVFSFLKVVPSGVAVQAIVDAARGPSSMFGALASGNQLATAAAALPNSNVGSPGYWTLDMGEITLPPGGSGVVGQESLRLWVNYGPSAVVGSTQIFFGGMYLLPVDGPAAILTHGLAVPTISSAAAGLAGNVNPTQGGVEFNGNNVDSILSIASFPASAPVPGNALTDLRSYYRGVPLRLSASITQLVFLTADRAQGATAGLGQGNVEFSQVSVSYRPAFQFLYGV